MRKPGPSEGDLLKGEDFVIALFRAIQTVRLYEDDRQIVQESIQQFAETARRLLEDGDLTCLVSEGRFFVQGERLRYRREILRLVHYMFDFFGCRDLKGLVFRSSMNQVPSEQILSFLRVFLRAVEHQEPWSWATQQMEERSFGWVEFLRADEPQTKEDEYDRRKRTRRVYWHAHGSVKEIARRLSMENKAGVRKSRRIVQNMVDLLFKDESILLGASTIRDHDDYTYSHSVNVAILSLCLGKRIGLSPVSLTHLGICGLFHDLGKVEVSRDILTKASSLTPDEWEEVRKHPLSSVRQVLKLRACHDLKSKILLAPFEHHLHCDLSGYPRLASIEKVSLFGRILQITDFYDAITSPRAYRPSPYSAHHALKLLLVGAGKEYDLILTKVFVAMMGMYPVGSLLQFHTGEMGLVVRGPGKGAGAFPRVALVVDTGQGVFERRQVFDLEEKDPVTGSPRRKVVRCLNPDACGIRPADFILGDGS